MPLKASMGTVTRPGEVIGGNGQATPTLRMLLLMANTLRFLTSSPPISQPTTHAPRIRERSRDPVRTINLIAGVLYLPAVTAAMMKITMDSLPNHK